MYLGSIVEHSKVDQRRTKRFKLHLPLAVTRAGAERVALSGVTRDISSSGVLFTAHREPDLGGPIEYIITLHGDAGQPVLLRCIGKIVRSERFLEAEETAFAVAATLERYEFVRDRTAPSPFPV
jgi:hypothetical protein